MDRKPLFAQFDGDEVEGKRYAIGDELASDTDAGTVAYLTGTGRFSATPPDQASPIPAGADRRPVAEMSRAEILAELGAGESDDRLREAVEMKREKLDEDAKREREEGTGGGGTDADPLAGNADAAISYVNGLDSVDALNDAKAREKAGKDRTTVVSAIDKRIEALG